MKLSDDQCYQIVHARDARYDGQLYVGVRSTGIYCRPVCPAIRPRPGNCRFFASAALAEHCGFRPCLRCRPELAPGLAPMDGTRRLARALVDRIHGGALEEAGLDALANEFHLSSRQVRRVIMAEFGVSPLAIARTRRLLLAKQLLTDSDLRLVDVAFASGFASVRQFNRVFRKTYGLTPSNLRRSRAFPAEEGIPLRLGFRPPLAWEALTMFLVSRSDGHTQGLVDGHYVRTLRVGGATGWLAARPVADNVLQVRLSSSLLHCLPALQQPLRQLFDLDADPRGIVRCLEGDEQLAPLVRQTPGLRLPGTLDGFELALRAILGQQISVKAATTVFRRIVERFGEPMDTPFPGLDRLSPTAERIAGLSQQDLLDCGLTRRRADTVLALARAAADDSLRLTASADREKTRQQLLALPGIGPWTTEYIAMRALGDPDAFPGSDLGLLRGTGVDKPAELEKRSQQWRPWRAYVACHVWHGLGQGG
ncbi:AraC family transcriptional regulator [Marinobacter zhanjiangensis]|uniref:DNA-3-methyladenine glycosylase II n=2 Tax=Marinobacter zhanjiangensis TaxID=578215 RepID=A0ABQ3ASJ4_9GAMM|nr:AraC family transcriptional regulator [Marinobacter zhanjiangensis]